MKKLKCIDLFCGAGGLSAGFKSAGFRILGAVDNTRYFVKPTMKIFPRRFHWYQIFVSYLQANLNLLLE